MEKNDFYKTLRERLEELSQNNSDVGYYLSRIAIRNRRSLKIMRIFKIDTEKRAEFCI
jgi:hypothetical protein